MQNSKIAIIDIGSNTVRLVIYHMRYGSFEECENIKAPIRLRTYLNSDNELSETGIELLISVLNSFKEVIDYHQVEHTDCTATAAVRQAANKEELIGKAKEQTGFHIRVLSGEEEAYFGLSAVTKTLPIENGLIVDMGGGSTEITCFKNRELQHTFSFPFGVVSLKEQFIKGNRMTECERDQLVSYVLNEFSQFPWLDSGADKVVAIGGSARNLAKVSQLKKAYPNIGIHGYEIDADEFTELHKELSVQTYEELEKVDGLSKERADLILPALEVFYQLLKYSRSSALAVSSRGLRDGLILEQMPGVSWETLHQVKQNGTMRIVKSYQLNEAHHHQMQFILSELLSQFTHEHLFDVAEDDQFFLEQAASLFYLGEYISSSSKSQHTFYLLTNSTLDGYSHKEKVKMALVASFTNYSTLKQYISSYDNWFTKEEIQQMREWGALLKLCFSLNSSKRNVVKRLKLTAGKEGLLKIKVFCERDYLSEKYQSDKQKKHLEKVLQRTIQLDFSKIDD
ncbi:exopolyphosphatase/guanosine-5'-triphosphate,3'-diphosphate pyrophosphatase [Bacillus ectoiniformans]|uniref:Ppx/GppA family phosphatase n=1 Tax=Bacillus ectoiniformans TaxID=1494429 RepID=UPI00195ECABE|nr:Ppx/GppA family phosphatase [Bacillus ectoiniformans]MBM7647308.1 exopolyphosphatase/guanosine-5'-triphosphate,3'-diphosphate pyrophosphatase [Bacillus ectoiniformans]